MYIDGVLQELREKKGKMGNKLWTCASDGKEKITGELIREKSHPRAIAMYLAARGIEARNVDFYFNASFADLSDPFRFPGIETAVKRLWKAIVNASTF